MAVLVACVIVIAAGMSYWKWAAHLPSDVEAENFFRSHRTELGDLAAFVEQHPNIEFVDANWISYGGNAKDGNHIACAEMLRHIGAQFLRRREGAIEIYVWGSGCAICHDSYKGYAFVEPKAEILTEAKLVASLEDDALPVGQYGTIKDGIYLKPLNQPWYLALWEAG